MNKKTKTILMVVAITVIIVALFIPYTKGEPEPILLNEFKCSDISENQENDTKLTKISCSKYQEITKSEDKSIILIARPSCGYCTKFIPVLEEIVEKYGITVNYFDTDALSEEEVSSFYNSSELYKGDFGTPTLLLVQNSEVLDYKSGYMEKDEAISWFEEIGMIANES